MTFLFFLLFLFSGSCCEGDAPADTSIPSFSGVSAAAVFKAPSIIDIGHQLLSFSFLVAIPSAIPFFFCF